MVTQGEGYRYYRPRLHQEGRNDHITVTQTPKYLYLLFSMKTEFNKIPKSYTLRIDIQILAEVSHSFAICVTCNDT